MSRSIRVVQQLLVVEVNTVVTECAYKIIDLRNVTSGMENSIHREHFLNQHYYHLWYSTHSYSYNSSIIFWTGNGKKNTQQVFFFCQLGSGLCDCRMDGPHLHIVLKIMLILKRTPYQVLCFSLRLKDN